MALLNRFSSSPTPNDCVEITEEEMLFLAASPHMPRHQQALEYRYMKLKIDEFLLYPLIKLFADFATCFRE